MLKIVGGTAYKNNEAVKEKEITAAPTITAKRSAATNSAALPNSAIQKEKKRRPAGAKEYDKYTTQEKQNIARKLIMTQKVGDTTIAGVIEKANGIEMIDITEFVRAVKLFNLIGLFIATTDGTLAMRVHVTVVEEKPLKKLIPELKKIDISLLGLGVY